MGKTKQYVEMDTSPSMIVNVYQIADKKKLIRSNLKVTRKQFDDFNSLSKHTKKVYEEIKKPK